MKKLISLLALLIGIAGCEIHPAPVVATVVVEPIAVEPYVCEPNPNDLRWASYCDGSCCYEKYYDNGWLCEDAWCYDYYYCGWEYMGDICY